MEDKDFIIYKSVSSFNPDKKAKFSTWLGNQTRYYCLNLINKKNKLVPVEIEELNRLREDQSEEQNLINRRKYLINLVNSFRDKRISSIFMMRYFSEEKEEKKWKNVCAKLNISVQTAINLHKKGKVILKEKLKKINLSKVY